MATVPEAFAIAIQHHRAGRLHAAGEIYSRILQVDPNHADALHMLGVASAQSGHHELAVECIRRALSLRPDWAEAHANLGNALREQGKLNEAVHSLQHALRLNPHDAAAHNNLGNAFRDLGNLTEASVCYRRALELRPDFAGALANLGTVSRDQGNLDEAVACYRRAIELKPDDVGAHYNLGLALIDIEKPEDAIVAYRRTLELKPDYPQAHNNLANAYKTLGKLDEAVVCYRRALELKPDYPVALNNLGLVLLDLGRREEAIGYYRRALDLKPDFADAYYNLGIALNDLGMVDEAIAAYRRALELNPDLAAAHNNLGNVLKNEGRFDEAMACYRRAIELKPDFALNFNNLGNALKDQGDLDQAIAYHRRALELNPDYAVAHSNLLYSLNYCPEVTLAALADAHAGYDRQHAVPDQHAAAGPGHGYHARHRDRLRLGFISPDLGRHPVGFFLVRVLENLRDDRHETICYSDRIVKDDMTHRLQTAATGWRDVNGMSHERLADQVRADRIDILFDLAGHTAHNRLLVFVRKPAPIQISWIGYVGTTGLRAMDYILADRYEIAPGSERFYCERVLRMPHGYVCYEPPDYSPAVSPLPALQKGYVTFGSFNNPAKIGPGVVEVWSRILRRLPDARLVLKYKGMNDRAVAGRLATKFASHGIDHRRVAFLGKSPHPDLLAQYHGIDIGLDPFPYSGGLTTCEALWMGVPVITCPGETFASRHSLSHLSNVGLTQTIAADHDEYVDLAVSLAADLPRLAAMRSTLREQMAASPLCDGKQFATSLATILRDAWERRGE